MAGFPLALFQALSKSRSARGDPHSLGVHPSPGHLPGAGRLWQAGRRHGAVRRRGSPRVAGREASNRRIGPWRFRWAKGSWGWERQLTRLTAPQKLKQFRYFLRWNSNDPIRVCLQPRASCLSPLTFWFTDPEKDCRRSENKWGGGSDGRG